MDVKCPGCLQALYTARKFDDLMRGRVYSIQFYCYYCILYILYIYYIPVLNTTLADAIFSSPLNNHVGAQFLP